VIRQGPRTAQRRWHSATLAIVALAMGRPPLRSRCSWNQRVARNGSAQRDV